MNRFRNVVFLPSLTLLIATLLPTSATATAVCDDDFAGNIVDVRMQTDLGGIDIRLRGDLAPITVANFCEYMIIGAYDGTFIHRSIADFVVQGGGWSHNPDNVSFFAPGASEVIDFDPIANEAGLPDALPNIRGTLAMAKTSDPDSATSQWFFNLVDNPGLDDPNNSGGFTVFAEVLDLDVDMGVVDDIGAQDVCRDIPSLGTVVCGTWSSTVQIGASRPTGLGFVPDNLLVVNYVGIDTDGDGIVDKVEAAGPGAGDADSNGTADSLQNNLASFDNITGGYVLLKSPAGTVLESLDVLSPAYAIAHPPPTFCGFKDFDFSHGFIGMKISGFSGTTVDVTLELPGTDTPDTFLGFDPAPPVDEPQWFDFLDNGTTGAEIIGSSVTLHFVDGGRGDNDGAVNGVIQSILGPLFNRTVFPDEDGLFGFTEDNAPNDGDGNRDFVKDRIQRHVASYPDLNLVRMTLAATSEAEALQVSSVSISPPQPWPSILNGLNFAHGLIAFEVCADPGPAVEVTMILPEGETPDSYYMYGSTPGNSTPHYYEFLFDPATGTGAVITEGSNEVVLHFVDGQRGDADLDANGVISDPGGPVFFSPTTNSGDGGGCSLRNTGNHPGQAGAWWLILAMISLAGIWRGGLARNV